MSHRKFISAVPVAILFAQRTSAAAARTRKKGIILKNRIGTLSLSWSKPSQGKGRSGRRGFSFNDYR